MKLTTTSDKKLSTIKALLYGDSGIGKTTSIGTLPIKTTLIAHTERSTLALRKLSYPVIQIECWQDVRKLLGWLKDPSACEDKEIRKAIESTKNLVIDSLSELADSCIKHIVSVDRKLLIAKREHGKRNTPEKTYEDMMTLEDWGLFGKRFLNMVSAFCHLPINVIMVCLGGWTKDRSGNDACCIPGLPGRMVPKDIGRYFDLVFHMESMKTDAGNDTRLWRTQHAPDIVAKGMPELDTFERPDWTKVFMKIFETKPESKVEKPKETSV